MICTICFEPINMLYYKNKCNCKAYYHYDCIIEWFKIENICPICKKISDNNIQSLIRRRDKFTKTCITLLIISFLLVFSLLYWL